jgi:isoleucyl-tRNA synthetase
MDEANYDLVDLHKNVVDEITLVSASENQWSVKRIWLMWFDSGSMPYAQWHYPLKIRIKLTQIKISWDFIAEGVDQTRDSIRYMRLRL